VIACFETKRQNELHVLLLTKHRLTGNATKIFSLDCHA